MRLTSAGTTTSALSPQPFRLRRKSTIFRIHIRSTRFVASLLSSVRGMISKTMAKADAYSWFNPKLRDNTYRTGDIYDEDKAKEAREQWKIET